jgi:hypothetical protein
MGPSASELERDAHLTIEAEQATQGARDRHSKMSSLTTFIDKAFDDKRVTIALISVWFCICLGGFTWLGIFSSAYMRVGPSPTLTYMGMPIDTMARYIAVVVFVMISTAINDFASDAIGPWIQNTVMDHKSQTIPYSKFTIIFITQMWSLYCGVMSVASIALVFAQFDLIMVRLVVDLFVNQYTMRRFLTNKSHDPFRYHNDYLNEDEMDTLAENGAGLETPQHLQSAAQHKVQAGLKREAHELDRLGAKHTVTLNLHAAKDDDSTASDGGGEAPLMDLHEATYQPSQFAGSKGSKSSKNSKKGAPGAGT